MRAAVAALAGCWLVVASASQACFGTRLRVGVPAEPGGALAAYAAGYFIQEKTGIEPEFVESGRGTLAAGKIDIQMAPAEAARPSGVAIRVAGNVPGLGDAQLWLRKDVLEDLRFFTVDRALALLPAFFSSAGYRQAAQSGGSPRKAARKAVLDGS